MIDGIHERAVFRRFGRGAVRSRSGPLTVVRASLLGSTRPAVAYAISRRVGGAVVRNRLRRQLRVACTELEKDGAFDAAAYLVVVQPEAAGSNMTTLRDSLRSALHRMPALDDGPPSAAHGGQAIGQSDISTPNDRSVR